MELVDPSNFLTLARDRTILDVRSPSEFDQGHISGAYNLPLFNDEERKIVGTLYKKAGRDASVLKGLELVGPKLADFIKQARKISHERRVLVHCWRGGMRSKNMAWLLETAGFETTVLAGGYKAYRQFIRKALGEDRNFIILGGKTGSGKTEILHELVGLGEQVLDLEGIAHHKGSAFGALGQPDQPTNEQFENDLYQAVQNFDPDRPLWLEDESRGIGRVSVPDTLFDQMRTSSVLFIDIPLDVRVKRLVKEYASFNQSQLIAAIGRITKRLGGLNAKLATEAIEKNEFETATGILLQYYDKNYYKGLGLRKSDLVHTITSNNGNTSLNAAKLKDYYYSILLRKTSKAGHHSF